MSIHILRFTRRRARADPGDAAIVLPGAVGAEHRSAGSQTIDRQEYRLVEDDVATSDGAAIFLPATIERFEARSENFDFLKVVLTQQAGHIEFGSFEFEFARAVDQIRRPEAEDQRIARIS